jgi:DNA-binding XRE family transcriptional regulator
LLVGRVPVEEVTSGRVIPAQAAADFDHGRVLIAMTDMELLTRRQYLAGHEVGRALVQRSAPFCATKSIVHCKAAALDVSRQTVISIENGRYLPSLPLAFRIARLLDMPIEKIFELDGEENT